MKSRGPRPSDILVAFFAIGVGWLAAAAAAGLLAAAGAGDDATWLALHLAFVGGVSQLVLGAAQFFVCAFLATTPPGRREIRMQLAVWNAGVVAIAVGVPTGVDPLTGLGGVAVLAGLVLFARSLRAMEHRSLQSAPWATRWYLASAAFLAAGAILGPVLAAEPVWTHGSLVAAHLVANLGGWFGTAIVGTLHTFHPSLTGTRLQRPQLQQPTFVAWLGGIVAVAAGAAFASTALAVAGWTALLAAAGMLGVNIVAGERAATQRTLAGALVAAAQALLVVGAVVAIVLTVRDGAGLVLVGGDRDVLAVLLAAGWIGMTVLGSLLHLLRVMAHVRGIGRPGARTVAPTRAERPPLALLAVALVVAAAVGRLADVTALATIGLGGLLVLYAALAARVVVLAVRALRAAPIGL